MTPPQEWRALEATLRPFIARRVATPADVDDVLQETFTRVHRGASQVADDERFGPWVYRVARNAIADHHRMRARHPVRGDDVPEVPEVRDEERVFTCRIDEHISAMVEMLPEPTRTTLRLSELEGRSQADIARALGVPLTTVRSRVQRGRARLREMVEAMCAVEVDARGRLVSCDHRADGCCGPARDEVSHAPPGTGCERGERMILRRRYSTLVLGLALGVSGAVTARVRPALAQQTAAYTTRGVIRTVAADRRSARIAHEAIPGFMNAMTMTFTARDAAQLQGLNPADRVTLRFTATPEGQLLIDTISRAP